MPNEGRILEELRDCVVNFQTERIGELAAEALRAGIDPHVVVTEGLSKGMEIVGQRYDAGRFFLSDLIMAGETMKAAMEVLKPHLSTLAGGGASGLVVIGTVHGDMHDLGKNIVSTLLSSSGFQVIDLGVDVPPEDFAKIVKERKPDILAMSSLLTTTMPNMRKTLQLLEDESLRDRVKVIIGGAPVTREFANEIGADAYGKDALEGLRICRTWVDAKAGR